jgi:hypothetical protein
MNKCQLIQEIQKLNPSAGDAFLELFTESDLSEYLGRLAEARQKMARCNPIPDSEAVRIAS